MAEYLCTIEIDVEADSMREAAEEAQELLRAPEAFPWVVGVRQRLPGDQLGPSQDIDLNNDPEQQ